MSRPDTSSYGARQRKPRGATAGTRATKKGPGGGPFSDRGKEWGEDAFPLGETDRGEPDHEAHHRHQKEGRSDPFNLAGEGGEGHVTPGVFAEPRGERGCPSGQPIDSTASVTQ